MIVDLKRCLSILLAVMLLVGIIPTAYAVESGADSTQPEKTVSEGTDSIDPTEPRSQRNRRIFRIRRTIMR